MLRRRGTKQFQPKSKSRSTNDSAVSSSTTTGKKSDSPADMSGITIALQFLDTTWRVVLPIAIFTYIGIRMDARYNTRPLYSLIGLFSSLILAIYLVYKQIKQAYPNFYKQVKKSK